MGFVALRRGGDLAGRSGPLKLVHWIGPMGVNYPHCHAQVVDHESVD